MEKKVFWLVLQSNKGQYHRMELVPKLFNNEDFFNWCGLQRTNVEAQEKTTAIIVNCGVVNT